MKPRPKGFLADCNLPQNSEQFDYIRELHEYLWRFVKTACPNANGNLDDHIDTALAKLEALKE